MDIFSRDLNNKNLINRLYLSGIQMLSIQMAFEYQTI